MIGDSSSVNMSDVKLARDELKKICSQFLVEDRYNFDETAKFFRMHPNKTLSNKAVNETKMDKSRFTVGICTMSLLMGLINSSPYSK